MKLIVLGNGFDLACGLKTSYFDFGKWMEENYSNTASYLYDMAFSNVEFGRNENQWTKFEQSLGCITPYEVADYSILYNEELNNLSDNLMEFISLAEEESSIIPDFEDLFTNFQGIILTFNYTKTPLRLGYKGDLLYLHGSCEDSDIIIGHNTRHDFDSPDSPYFGRFYNIAENELGNAYQIDELMELCNNISSLYFKRHLSNYQAIRQNLLSLSVEEIIVCGVSYNEIDFEYFRLLNEDFKQVNWTFTYYEEDEDCLARVEKYEQDLKLSGTVNKIKYRHLNELRDLFHNS